MSKITLEDSQILRHHDLEYTNVRIIKVPDGARFDVTSNKIMSGDEFAEFIELCKEALRLGI